MNPRLTAAKSRLAAMLGSPRRALGYAAFTLLCLGCNLYWTFPAAALGSRLAHELQQRSDGAWRLSFAAAAPWRLSGLSLRDVDLLRLPPSDAAAPVPLHLDRLQARLQVLPLLLGRLRWVVEARQGRGALNAWLAPAQRSVDVALKLVDISLDQPVLQAQTGMAAAGRLSGELAELHWEPELSKWSAQAKLQLQGARLGPGAVASMSLPAMALGNLELQLSLVEGQARLQNFRQQGGVLTLRAQGGVGLKLPLIGSTFDLCATLRAAPDFLAAQPRLATALQIAAAQLRRDPDGTLHLPLQGSFGAPRLGQAACR